MALSTKPPGTGWLGGGGTEACDRRGRGDKVFLTSQFTCRLAAQPDHPPRKGKLGPPATKHLLDLGHFHPRIPTGHRILRGAVDRYQTDIMEDTFLPLFWANSHCPSETQLQCHLPDPSLFASPPSPSGCLCVTSEPHHTAVFASLRSPGAGHVFVTPSALYRAATQQHPGNGCLVST